jgi:hypothetical protein
VSSNDEWYSKDHICVHPEPILSQVKCLNHHIQGEKKPGIITFYDKKGNTICIVSVSYKVQVIVKNITDVSEALKNLTIPTDVKDKKAEEKVDTEKESVLSDIDKKVGVQQYKLLAHIGFKVKR